MLNKGRFRFCVLFILALHSGCVEAQSSCGIEDALKICLESEVLRNDVLPYSCEDTCQVYVHEEGITDAPIYYHNGDYVLELLYIENGFTSDSILYKSREEVLSDTCYTVNQVHGVIVDYEEHHEFGVTLLFRCSGTIVRSRFKCNSGKLEHLSDRVYLY